MESLFKRQSSQNFSVQPTQRTYAYSVSGGAGGQGIKISTAYGGARASWLTPSFGGRKAGYDYGWHDYQSSSSGSASETLTIGNEKITMQHLNDRLASYLETVRNLEKANSVLEIKIREAMEKRGSLEDKDYGRYNNTITELRVKILDMIKGSAHFAVALGNASLASEDFRDKMEYEMAMRQTVEADVARLRKLVDDTNIDRLHLETGIESLKEDLINLTKNHETDVAELRAQITYGVHVDVDAPKGQDLARIMEEMRDKYEKITLKNQEDLKAWHESQITEVQVKVTEQTTALKEATTVITDTKRSWQRLDIELQSELGFKANLEANLCDIEMQYNRELEKYNAKILSLQEQLTQLSINTQNKKQACVKMDAEIIEYRRLLDGSADFKHEDAVDHKNVCTQVVTVTQTLVDGKVVAESTDVKSTG